MDGVPDYLKCQHVLIKMGRYHCYASPLGATEWEHHATLDISLTTNAYFTERSRTREGAIKRLYLSVRECLWEICMAVEL